jgi:isopenicillin-N epimerase
MPANPLRQHWLLRDDVTFLNHGSFGACPKPVLSKQSSLREQLEREPVDFLVRDLPDLWNVAKREVADFIGADPAGLGVVRNATEGVNAVLRSLRLEPGEAILVTDHSYNACRNVAMHVAQQWGGRVDVAVVPFPVASVEQVVEAILRAVTPQTRIALLDHVTSPTGMVLPVEILVPALQSRGVDVIIDGAQAPGMIDLNVDALGAAYYAGNCHKWLCGPKGSGFLVVREDVREPVRPTIISHGANQRRPQSTRFVDEFDWQGTSDPSAFLCVPDAIEFMGGLLPGGWRALREHNRSQALDARAMLCDRLGISPATPDDMVGSLAAVALPGPAPGIEPTMLRQHSLQAWFRETHAIELTGSDRDELPGPILRVSTEIYNCAGEFERVGDILAERYQ